MNYYDYTFRFFILIYYLHFASQLCRLQSLIPRGDERKINLMPLGLRSYFTVSLLVEMRGP